MEALEQCWPLTIELQEALTAQQHRAAAISAEMDSLIETGVFDAIPSESWESRNGNQNNYLRLVYPTSGGKRRRDYVGSNVTKIKEARAKINRTQRLHDLQREHQIITNQTILAKSSLSHAIRHLRGEVVW